MPDSALAFDSAPALDVPEDDEVPLTPPSQARGAIGGAAVLGRADGTQEVPLHSWRLPASEAGSPEQAPLEDAPSGPMQIPDIELLREHVIHAAAQERARFIAEVMQVEEIARDFGSEAIPQAVPPGSHQPTHPPSLWDRGEATADNEVIRGGHGEQRSADLQQLLRATQAAIEASALANTSPVGSLPEPRGSPTRPSLCAAGGLGAVKPTAGGGALGPTSQVHGAGAVSSAAGFVGPGPFWIAGDNILRRPEAGEGAPPAADCPGSEEADRDMVAECVKMIAAVAEVHKDANHLRTS